MTALPSAITELYAKAFEHPDMRRQTSDEIYSDLYFWIASNWAHGHGIIEVGVYRGAAAITLAYAAREFKMPYVAIDTDSFNLIFTCKMLTSLGIVDPAYGFDGTLAQFAPKSPLTRSPLLVFLDGDHDYDAVIADLRAVYAMKNRPHAIALHDFHLRSHRLKNTGVDRAVFDAFGEDVAYQRIGVQWGAEPVPGIDCPTESGCYWQPNGTEGALILLENYPELRV